MLDEEKKTVQDYLKNPPFKELPLIEDSAFSQRKLAGLLNIIWEKVLLKLKSKKTKEEVAQFYYG